MKKVDDPLRFDLDPLRVEVDLLRVEADRLWAEADPLRSANVLIVGADYAPRSEAAARTTAMAHDLAEIAERVTVFTGGPSPQRNRLPFIPGQTRRTLDVDNGVHLVRHHHHGLGRPGPLAQARSERSFLRAVLRSPVRVAADVVIGVLPSVGAAVAAARVAERSKAPLLLVVPDLAPPGGPGRAGRLIGAAMGRGQAEALRHASRVVVLGSDLRASVIALGVAERRIDVVLGPARARPESLDLAAPAPGPTGSPENSGGRDTGLRDVVRALLTAGI